KRSSARSTSPADAGARDLRGGAARRRAGRPALTRRARATSEGPGERGARRRGEPVRPHPERGQHQRGQAHGGGIPRLVAAGGAGPPRGGAGGGGGAPAGSARGKPITSVPVLVANAVPPATAGTPASRARLASALSGWPCARWTIGPESPWPASPTSATTGPAR